MSRRVCGECGYVYQDPTPPPPPVPGSKEAEVAHQIEDFVRRST